MNCVLSVPTKPSHTKDWRLYRSKMQRLFASLLIRDVSRSLSWTQMTIESYLFTSLFQITNMGFENPTELLLWARYYEEPWIQSRMRGRCGLSPGELRLYERPTSHYCQLGQLSVMPPCSCFPLPSSAPLPGLNFYSAFERLISDLYISSISFFTFRMPAKCSQSMCRPAPVALFPCASRILPFHGRSVKTETKIRTNELWEEAE